MVSSEELFEVSLIGNQKWQYGRENRKYLTLELWQIAPKFQRQVWSFDNCELCESALADDCDNDRDQRQQIVAE